MILKVIGCTGSDGTTKCCFCDMAFDHKRCISYREQNHREYIEQPKIRTRD